jgi:ABC-type sugar transport system substrate-binding protein
MSRSQLSRSRRWRASSFVVVGMVAATLTTGFGSSLSEASTNGGSGGQSLSQEVAHATAAVHAAEQAPTRILVPSVQFPHKPPTGKTVAMMVPGLSAATDLTGPFQAAAKILGWKIVPIAYDDSNPATLNGAFQQAVNEHVNYIIPLAVASTVFAPGLAAAKAAGIPVLEFATATEANASQRGIISCYECTAWTDLIGTTDADVVISDSQGHANGAYIDIPEIPSLGNIATSFVRQLNTKCSGCKGAVIPSSVDALGAGTVGNQVVAYLQAHPSVNWVGIPTDGIADNLPQLLQTAGLAGKVKIVMGGAGAKVDLQDIAKGKMSAGLSLSDGLGGWAVMYDLAANSLGSSLPAEIPSQFVLWTTGNIPKQLKSWTGPPNYEQQFKTLEHLTSG